MTPTKPEDALVERLRGPFNYDPGAMQDALLEAADAITTLLERERSFAAIIDRTDEEGFTPEIEQELMDLRAALTEPNPDREV